MTAVDGTAAGDAFCAALVVSLLEGRERGAALQRACAAGALAAAGAAPSRHCRPPPRSTPFWPPDLSGQHRRAPRISLSAARAATSPGTPCTAAPGKVAALPRNKPRTGVRYDDSLGTGRKIVWRSQ